MKYSGIKVYSLIDYPGKVSLVIFMAKCPLKCPYCHNQELIDGGTEIDLSDILRDIENAVDYIDAVVLCGGEPLVQIKDAVEILKYSKELGLKTKLDTSGYYYDRLEKVLPYLDYVALDFKAPYDKYKEITGFNIGDRVKKSMEIINKYSNIFLECRTTYVPYLLERDDIIRISWEIECDLYTLQQYVDEYVLDETRNRISSPGLDEIKEIAKEIEPDLNKVKVVGIEI
jgi:pyruvate formate lyase activating enzyme